MNSSWKDKLITSTGSHTVYLPAGIYKFVIRGGGGAGGQGEYKGTYGSGSGSVGGAGAKGELSVRSPIVVPSYMSATVYVGAGGKTKPNGGNGGNGGSVTDCGQTPGAGGGGGVPSYVYFNGTYYIAEGGGGGGGGGASQPAASRYSDGASGGGGGGYYRINYSTGAISSVAGKTGGNGGVRTAGDATMTNPQNGTAGNTTEFPSLRSGYGAGGNGVSGGNGASGGGASGGGGGYGTGNSTSSRGGGGGGGAPGSTEAGGGCGGIGYTNGNNGSNYYSDPIDITSENAPYGVNGNYGRGGKGGTNVAPTNGGSGFVLIQRIGSL